jgi:hypothetical protein
LRHGLPWKSLPKLLKRRVLDLRELCKHVHLSLLQCLLSLLSLRDLGRLDCWDVALMGRGFLLNLRSSPSRHGVVIRSNLREGLSVLRRPWCSCELLDSTIHGGLDHLHDLQNPLLLSVASS